MTKQNVLSSMGRRTPPPPITWLMQLPLSRPGLISLAAGFTDNRSLPVADARALLDDLLRSPKSGQAAMQYGSNIGDPILRAMSADRIRRLDGVPGTTGVVYDPERILITNGSQQFLYMLSEALCDPDDIVLVEDPTYFVFLGIIKSHGLRGRGIRVNRNGINVESLKAVLEQLKREGELHRVKMLYLVTYFQNPTGRSTTLRVKEKVLDVLRHYAKAAGHPIYLVEDAAYRELAFGGEPEPSALVCRGAADWVIYAGTYSKPFATGIRIGFGLLPKALLPVVLRLKGNHDFGSSNLPQQLLLRAVRSGLYEKHLERIRKRYALKAIAMIRAITRWFPASVDWESPEGGLYVWARAPKRLVTGMKSRFFRNALEKEVLYVPGGICYVDDPVRRKPSHEMRLSFGGAPDRAIPEGIRRLGETLAEFM